MSLICGTDFSEASLPAVRAAAHLARRMQLPLHLVHSVELGFEAHFDEPRREAERWARAQLQALAARLSEPSVQVHTHVLSLPPDEALEEVAENQGGRLIIVAALGRRRPGAWQLGSHAERLAHRARVPVLVVRAVGPFEAWAHSQRPLRILLGLDMSRTSDAAMHWIHELARFGPCEVTAAHLYWPPAQFERLGLTGIRSHVDADPVVTATLERDFTARATHVLGDVPFKLHLEPHVGGIGTRLAALAGELGSDLVVVGTHGRSGVDPVLLGTVSHSVAHGAATSVACIPSSLASVEAPPRHPTSVLVATDFSETGNAAIAMAYSIVAKGGSVHLVHVVPEHGRHPADPRDVFVASGATPQETDSSLCKQLLGLVPAGTPEAQVHAHAHVLVASDAAQAISQAAERLGVDLVCVGTHGRTGLSKVLLGSVAQSVVGATTRPVLLVRPPRA